jgi:hypothetical protein
MGDLTAIDILINPDETMLTQAKAANARMRASVPESFALNEHHQPVGLAKLDDLAKIEAEPFDTFTFSAAGLGVYHLGNNGTAAKQLKSWGI